MTRHGLRSMGSKIAIGAALGVVVAAVVVYFQLGNGMALAFGSADDMYVLSVAASTPQPATIISNEREAWAVDLAARLGNPQPSRDMIAFLVEWSLAEDASGGAFER